jgi:hypothetical protein
MDMSWSLHFWMWPAWLKPKHLSITCWFPPQILVHIVLRDCHHGHFLPWEQHGSLWSYYLSLTLWNQTVIFHNTSFHQSKTWFLTPYHPNTTNFLFNIPISATSIFILHSSILHCSALNRNKSASSNVGTGTKGTRC